MSTNPLLFFNLGGGEIFMIVFLVLLLFGSKKIPELARGLGKGIRYFKEATSDVQNEINDSIKDVKDDVDITKNLK
jgi:sec-independent protein translocase protein TatA